MANLKMASELVRLAKEIMAGMGRGKFSQNWVDSVVKKIEDTYEGEAVWVRGLTYSTGRDPIADSFKYHVFVILENNGTFTATNCSGRTGVTQIVQNPVYQGDDFGAAVRTIMKKISTKTNRSEPYRLRPEYNVDMEMANARTASNDEQKRFAAFARELEKLSLKYGVAITSVGGVDFGHIKRIKYSDDSTSGDLIPTVTFE